MLPLAPSGCHGRTQPAQSFKPSNSRGPSRQQDDLRAKITQDRATAEAAQSTFKRLFADAGHVVTKEVQKALFAKNDALSIALKESEASSFDAKVAASRDAQRYDAAYGRAFEAYARQQIYQAMVDCEQSMGARWRSRSTCRCLTGATASPSTSRTHAWASYGPS